MTPGVEPRAVCLHSVTVMKGVARIALFLLAAGLLRAEDPAPKPKPTPIAEIEIMADEKPAAEATPESSNPKMRKEVNLTETPADTGSFDIEPPADSPSPDKAPEVTGPLPGDEEVPARPPVTGTIDVGAKENGKIVAAKVGNLIRISLESNPSTGYNWELRGFEFGTAVFCSSDLAPRDTGSMLFGAPGDTVITLQAVQPGTQKIELVYRRPWEQPDQVAGAFSFQLEVTGEAPPVPAASPAP